MKNKKNPETFGSRWRYVWVLFALVFSVSVAAQKTVANVQKFMADRREF